MTYKTTFVPTIALSLLLLTGLEKSVRAVALNMAGAKEVAAAPVTVSSLFDRAVQVAESISNKNEKIRALSTVAVKLAAAKQLQHSSELFDQAIQLAQHQDDKFSQYEQGEALHDISIQLVEAGQFDRGLRLAKTIPSDSSVFDKQAETLRDMSLQLAQTGQFDQALKLVKTISSKLHQAQAHSGIATALADKGYWQKAKTVLLEALQNAKGITDDDSAYQSNGSCANYKFEVLSQIAGTLSLLSQVEIALEVANSVSGCTSATGDSAQDYQALAFLGILGHLKQVQDIQQTWQRAQSVHYPHEKAEVWGAIALKQLDVGETAGAMLIARKLVTAFPLPSGDSQSEDIIYEWERLLPTRDKALQDIAIKLAEQKNIAAALEVVQLMNIAPRPKDNIDDSNLKDSRDAALKAIVRQLVASGQKSQALQLVNRIPDTEGKALAEIAIAQELQKMGRLAEATEILQHLTLPTPTKPHDSSNDKAIGHIATALVTVGEQNRALQLVQKIDNREAALVEVAKELSNSGQIEAALKIVDALEEKYFQKEVLNQVAKKLIDMGKLDQALQVAAKKSGSSSSEQEYETTEILADIAHKFVQAHQGESAIRAAEAMIDGEQKAEAYAAIAAGAAQF